MPDSTLQVAAGQTGDKVRTARKTVDGEEVHEQYVVLDPPWTIVGSYFWGDDFTGTTGVDSNGILAALYRPASASYDIIVRRLFVGFYNEGSANANTLAIARTTALGGAGSTVPTGKKDTDSPSPEGLIYVKPSGITMTAGEIAQKQNIWVKPSTAGAYGAFYEELSVEGEPFVLGSDEGLVLFQTAAGTTTEVWQAGFEWQEAVL